MTFALPNGYCLELYVCGGRERTIKTSQLITPRQDREEKREPYIGKTGVGQDGEEREKERERAASWQIDGSSKAT